MNNGMDDNVPDVCVICGRIISPEEDTGEFDLCLNCQRGGICAVERGLDPWHPEAFVGTPAEKFAAAIWGGKQQDSLTPKQAGFLRFKGVPEAELIGLTKREASKRIEELTRS